MGKKDTILGVKVDFFDEIMTTTCLENLFKNYPYNNYYKKEYYDIEYIKNNPKEFTSIFIEVWELNLGPITIDYVDVPMENYDTDWAIDLMEVCCNTGSKNSTKIFYCFIGFGFDSIVSLEELDAKRKNIEEFCREHLQKLGLKSRPIKLYTREAYQEHY